MNGLSRERALELLPIIKAYAEGKEIEYSSNGDEWQKLNYLVYNKGFEDDKFYRIKPENKYRPWKPEEVPVGALIKWINPDLYTGQRGFDIAIIIAISGCRIITGIHASNYTFEKCLLMFNHSTDYGKTWLPCGVIE